MEVRAKKALGQHFLTDKSIARSIVEALDVSDFPQTSVSEPSGARAVLEIGPGMGVLTGFLLQRPDIDLSLVEIDHESVDYLLSHFPETEGRLIQADFLKMKLDRLFPGEFSIIGNFPYNISSQIFFRILDRKDCIPQVVCMIQKEVAERIAEKPGTKTYGILSVLLQAWYDIEYLFTVGPGAFSPPPKVHSAVIRLRRNSRESLGCDEALFKAVVKTAFNQRRKTLRNSLKPLLKTLSAASSSVVPPMGQISGHAAMPGSQPVPAVPSGNAPLDNPDFWADPVFDLRPERLSVEDFIALTRRFG